jgi:TonB family protein
MPGKNILSARQANCLALSRFATVTILAIFLAARFNWQSKASANSQQSQQTIASYVASVQNTIVSFWHPPAALKKDGAVTVRLNIAADGTLSNAKIVKSSGDQEVDLSALSAINAASPVKAPIAAITTIPVILEMDFDVNVRTGTSANADLERLCRLADAERSAGQWEAAIKKYQACLKQDPHYAPASHGLTGLWFNRANFCQDDPERALNYIHEALLIERDQTSIGTLNKIICRLGKNPKSFADRIALSEEASSSGSPAGAIVELREALLIQEDAPARAQLDILERAHRQKNLEGR